MNEGVDQLVTARTGRLEAVQTGRLAPSPTGHLHLGNAWAFLWAWLVCRQTHGRLILRMEDIDPDRSTAAYAADILHDLRWLGLTWDGEPYIQSKRHALYAKALATLEQRGRAYPCYCTRKELREQLRLMGGAPHVDDRGAPYPGTCRHLSARAQAAQEALGRRACVRCNTEGLGLQTFTDTVLGPQKFLLDECGGDFALRRSDGVYAYQLAVVVDDGLMGVTQVVRGNDILVSTPRQIALQRLLRFVQPEYAHIPLLCNARGERLAKRHESLTLQRLRAAGLSAEQVIGFLAYKAGFLSKPAPCPPHALLPLFDIRRLNTERVLFEEQELVHS